MPLLAADIGGTKTWLQITERRTKETQGTMAVLYQQRYVSGRYGNFDTLLAEFLRAAAQAGVPAPTVACIGVAGPVGTTGPQHQRARVTNLPWVLDSHVLAEKFSFTQCRLINDFQAAGYGIDTLGSEDILVLQEGQARARGARVVIGAGTGLGQALLVWTPDGHGGYYDVLPSEGGHGDFAPAGPQQRELLMFLARSQPRVCVEDVLSGRGLVNVYRFLAQQWPERVSVAIATALETDDAPAAISAAALSPESAQDTLASEALDLFIAIYGAQAGNLALTCLATGGVYITGGIAPRIESRLRQGGFIDAFRDKGPMSALVEGFSVSVVLNPQVGLQGAALAATRL
ncbi:MAG: glucokinase [Gammaproteobacteria bacterium]|nr:glucokinase [Gammaproteobacteria bacterium]